MLCSVIARSAFLSCVVVLAALVSACGGNAAPASSAATAASPAASTATKPAGSAPATAASASAVPAARPAASASAAPSAASGTVTVYGALTQENGDAFAKAFEATAPSVKVSMVVAGSGPLMSRIAAEQNAGGVKADVILLADPTAMNGLVASGLIADYAPRDASQLPQSLRGAGWSGAFTFNNLILERTGIATPAKDWSDLTNQAYKGTLELGDPAASGTTLAMAGTLSQALGWDYFRSLQKLGARVVSSTNTVGTDIAGGQMQVGITLDSVGRDLVKKGSPVEMAWPASGAIPVPAPVGIVKGHDSAAAKAFVDWLISPQGQATSVQLGYAPAYGPSDAVPPGTKTMAVDWDQLAKNRDSILTTFKSIFG
jgi:iron(III) transport system substrate-binding protein